MRELWALMSLMAKHGRGVPLEEGVERRRGRKGGKGKGMDAERGRRLVGERRNGVKKEGKEQEERKRGSGSLRWPLYREEG